MSLRDKLTGENVGRFGSLIFYAIVGLIFLVWLPMADFLPTMGIIGILSLFTAYGLFTKRGWALWFVIVLFFAATAHSVFTLYYLMGEDLLLELGSLAYMILTWIITVYLVAKRKMFQP